MMDVKNSTQWLGQKKVVVRGVVCEKPAKATKSHLHLVAVTCDDGRWYIAEMKFVWRGTLWKGLLQQHWVSKRESLECWIHRCGLSSHAVLPLFLSQPDQVRICLEDKELFCISPTDASILPAFTQMLSMLEADDSKERLSGLVLRFEGLVGCLMQQARRNSGLCN